MLRDSATSAALEGSMAMATAGRQTDQRQREENERAIITLSHFTIYRDYVRLRVVKPFRSLARRVGRSGSRRQNVPTDDDKTEEMAMGRRKRTEGRLSGIGRGEMHSLHSCVRSFVRPSLVGQSPQLSIVTEREARSPSILSFLRQQRGLNPRNLQLQRKSPAGIPFDGRRQI